MQKILIVEDDLKIGEIECDYLRNSSYECEIIGDGVLAEEIIRSRIDEFVLVILDINLPGVNGLDLCRQIKHSSTIPVIMVTAKTKEDDEFVGLEVGADDYLRKPFSPRILVARVQKLLNKNVRGEIKVGNFLLIPNKNKVLYDGQDLELTNLQFLIMKAFMKNPGIVMSRESLIEQSIRNDIEPDIFERTIDSHIKNLRKRIEQDSHHPKFIKTVRGKGYVFF